MGQVLTLTEGRRSARRAPVRKDAEIVIFPGVRVEYHEDHRPVPAPAKASARPS